MSIRSGLGSIRAISTTTSSSGTIRQIVSALTAAVNSTTASMSWNDTIPQASQGLILLSATITPGSTGNTLLIMAQAAFAVPGPGEGVFAIFAGPTGGASGDAKVAVAQDIANSNDPYIASILWSGNPTAATQHVYSLRVGSNAGNLLTINGASGGRYLGGVNNTSLIIMEVVG